MTKYAMKLDDFHDVLDWSWTAFEFLQSITTDNA